VAVGSGRTRWFAAAVVALVAALYVASLPLYAGQSFEGGLSWRMEHGRVTIERRPEGRAKPFWADLNSEGLRWSADWRRGGPADWALTIPLWIPFALSAAWCALSWRRRSRVSGRTSAAQ
jgi:hypothetical protein